MTKRRARKDRLTKAARSALMGRIKSKDTNFERLIFSALTRAGIRFKRHFNLAFGNPDIALPKTKKAVFLHSDFWHGWRLPAWQSVLPNEFWYKKLLRNRARDKRVLRTLRSRGWKVLVVWEHQIENAPSKTMARIKRFLR